MACNTDAVTVLTGRKDKIWAFNRGRVRSLFSSEWYRYDALSKQYCPQILALPFEDDVSCETFLKTMGEISFFVECRKGAFYE